jgi:hypothetical protein
MDCREFRERHAPYVDLMCSAIDEREMREHVRQCASCARHDTLVRRSLMLVRNLPVIEPSADFAQRLQARLRTMPAMPVEPVRSSFRSFAAVAAGIMLVAALAAGVATRQHEPLRLSPVVATLPDVESSHAATPAFVATVPTGMSVWPAIMVASQAQMHFVAAELASER